MKKEYQHRRATSFRLTQFTLNELHQLSKEHQTNATAIVELAIARLAAQQGQKVWS